MNDPARRYECPGCSGTAVLDAAGLGDCDRCGGLIGQNVKPEVAYRWVKSEWCQCPDGIKQERYFDMTITTVESAHRRRHGWYHVQCQRIVQTG